MKFRPFLETLVLVCVPLVSGFWTYRTWDLDRQPPVPSLVQRVFCHSLPDGSKYLRVDVILSQTSAGMDQRLYCLERQNVRDLGVMPTSLHFGNVHPSDWSVLNDAMPECSSPNLRVTLVSGEMVTLSRSYRVRPSVKILEIYSSVARSKDLEKWDKDPGGWDIVTSVILSRDCTGV